MKRKKIIQLFCPQNSPYLSNEPKVIAECLIVRDCPVFLY